MRHVGLWGRSILGRGNIKCNDQEQGVCLAYRRDSKDVRMPGVRWVRKSSKEVKSEESREGRWN